MNKKAMYLILVLVSVFVPAAIILFIVSQTTSGNIIKAPTFQIISNTLALGGFLSSALFSFLLVKQGEDNRKHNDMVNARSEAARDLGFIAANHTIIDFYDSFTVSYMSTRYLARLKKSQDFTFFMRDNGIDLDNVKENMDEYIFVTVKIPIRVVVGTAVSSIQFKNIKMNRQDKVHNFIPCARNFSALILYNDDKKCQEVSVNLITTKDSEFAQQDVVNPFTKIKFFLTMHSFLGVAVTGWTELYFSNPQNLEKDGANKYKINSTQFQIVGLPTLKKSVEDDISQMIDQ